MKRVIFIIVVLLASVAIIFSLAVVGCNRAQKNIQNNIRKNNAKKNTLNNIQKNNTQKDTSNNIQEDTTYNIQNNNVQEYTTDNIEYISSYIFNDLKLKWKYNNIEEILNILNITDNYTIKESIVKNTIHSGTGYIFRYVIETNLYKIGLWAASDNNSFINEPIIYRLDNIEVKLNESNYLKLFPHKNMKDYMDNKKFGDISSLNQGENNIYYDMRAIILEYTKEGDYFGNADLIFNNGLLESITIVGFTP